ncbi:TMV resistance protein N-like [Trifolium medium]|uniref:TMV resistance protein N-like n=1 Tax=Trifolium medium TaxID=97028 RepID=A0A392PAL7_9FABA|nr:TMV resistance protein N-like [Trifolium medium]
MAANQNTCSETNSMKAFYASLGSSETTPLSHGFYVPIEKTKKAIHILQELLSKKFSLLLHPGRSIVLKDTLKYLLTLPQNEGFCMTTKSELQKLLQCFEQWSVEYHNASGLSITAKTELSNASEVMNDLEANVKEFHEMDKEEMCLCNKLNCLQERKRKLEEQIEIINVEIAKSTKEKDKVGKSKTELYQKGRELKAKRDDLMINVPRLKAEQDLANKTRDNIEAEWFKLQKQFMPLVARVASSSLPPQASHA